LPEGRHVPTEAPHDWTDSCPGYEKRLDS